MEKPSAKDMANECARARHRKAGGLIWLDIGGVAAGVGGLGRALLNAWRVVDSCSRTAGTVIICTTISVLMRRQK